jgi:hypothetical protein
MKLIKILVFTLLFLQIAIAQKNVGIGLTNPSSRLHIHQENDVNDPFSALQLTDSISGTTLTDGLRLYMMGNKAYFNNQENGTLSLGTRTNDIINILGSGKIGINTETIIGSSDLTLNSLNSNGFGGMYINSGDNGAGKPFYGYAIDGTAKAWTYFNASSNNWIVNNGADRMVVTNTGAVGVGNLSPTQKLDVNGRIKIGTEISAETAGSIQYKDGDFSGYNQEGEWKSFTKVDPKEAMSYDHLIPFEDCPNSPFILDASLNFGSTSNSCGVIYDSGGPSGNYGNNEDYIFSIVGGYGTYKIIVEELKIQDFSDKLLIGGPGPIRVELSKSILMPDTILLEPSSGMFIRFISNSSFTQSGFKIRWELMDIPTSTKNQFTGFYYDESKLAIAAGMNVANYWTDSLGDYAIALGTGANACGPHSFSSGIRSTSRGQSAIALGFEAKALRNASIAIGAESEADYVGSTSLGYRAKTTAVNNITIGSSNIFSIGGYSAWTNLSDGRFKKNVREDIPGLSFINQLRPVSYNLDLERLDRHLGQQSDNEDLYRTQAEQEVRTGFIAQEVLRAAEGISYDFSGIKKPQNENDHYGLRYAEFVVPLVKAVQELSEENEALRLEVEALKTIEKRLAKLEEEVH